MAKSAFLNGWRFLDFAIGGGRLAAVGMRGSGGGVMVWGQCWGGRARLGAEIPGIVGPRWGQRRSLFERFRTGRVVHELVKVLLCNDLRVIVDGAYGDVNWWQRRPTYWLSYFCVTS